MSPELISDTPDRVPRMGRGHVEAPDRPASAALACRAQRTRAIFPLGDHGGMSMSRLRESRVICSQLDAPCRNSLKVILFKCRVIQEK
jgi:hypothetical protein